MKAPEKKSARTPRSNKQGILVLGMHRSGTSALTRVLNLLGCALPANLIGPGDGNVLGHWEAIDAVTLNDEILASAGSSWEDWGPLNEDWNHSGLRPEMLQRITALVEKHAELGPLFAVKDPRICRIADLWLEGMDAAGIEPLVVLMVRNPAEVIRSLESRDLMAPSYGQLLWLRHVLDAESASRGRKRVVCRYDQLMDNWHGTITEIRSGLGVSLPRNSRKTHAEIEAFLSREQQHQSVELKAALDDPWLSEWVRRTLAIMVRWSEQGEIPDDFVELDAIRREFDNSYAAFAGLLLNSDGAGSVGSGSHLRRELSEQLVNAQNAAERARIVIAEAEAREAVAAEQRVELASQIEIAEARAVALQAELEGLRSESDRLGQEAVQVGLLRQREAELSAEVENARGQAIALQAELEGLRSETERLGQEAAQVELLRQREAELSVELEGARGLATDLQAELEGLRSESVRLGQEAAQVELLRQREEELCAEIENSRGMIQMLEAELQQSKMDADQWQQMATILEERIAALDKALESAREESQAATIKLVVAEEKLAAAARERDRQAEHNAELAGRVATSESALIQRQEELAQLWQQLIAAEKAASAAEARATLERERRSDLNVRSEALAQQASILKDELETARAAKVDDQRNLATRSDEIAKLTLMLQEQEAATARCDAEKSLLQRQLTEVLEEHAQIREVLQQRETTIQAIDHAKSLAEQKMSAHFDELASMTALLVSENDKFARAIADVDWLRRVNQLAANFPKWWALMPSSWRQRREHRRYQRAGLFDAEAYLNLYPDVAADGMDPVRHYMLHGMAEGRTKP